jgi:hypothetical protein
MLFSGKIEYPWVHVMCSLSGVAPKTGKKGNDNDHLYFIGSNISAYPQTSPESERNPCFP